MTTTREKIDSLTTQINSQREHFRQLTSEVNRVMVGQDDLLHHVHLEDGVETVLFV